MKRFNRSFSIKSDASLIRRNGKPSLLERFKMFWIKGYYETKISIKTESKKQLLTDFFWMILGNVVLAFGTQVFIIKNELITGGVSGLGLILEELFNNSNINVNLIITILTWVLFFIGLLLLGIRFAFKTLVATIIFPPLLYLFSALVQALPWLSLPDTDLGCVLGAVFGGVFVGVGCGFTFIGGGSTGGVDCLSLAANKYLSVKTSIAAFVVDAAIIIVGFIIKKDLSQCLIGIISALMAAIMIDRVFLGQSSSFIAFIISDKCDEISDRINSEMERGTTMFLAEGGYTHSSRKVIQVVFDRKEYRDLQNIIADVDTSAFVTTMRAHEVNGYGFKKISRKKVSLEEVIAADKKLSKKKEDKNK